MAITNTLAIQFSNEHIRPTADKLTRSFYMLQKLRNDWNALTGTDQEKFDILKADIQRIADRISKFRDDIFKSKRLYDALSMNTLFPNDPLEIVVDGAPADGRGQITGQDVRRLNARMKEWLAWLEKAAFDDASLNPLNYNYLEHFLRVNTLAVTADWGKTIAVNRAADLVTEYTVTNPSYLTHISKVAVNGNPNP
jgi:hypothetical protein